VSLEDTELPAGASGETLCVPPPGRRRARPDPYRGQDVRAFVLRMIRFVSAPPTTRLR